MLAGNPEGRTRWGIEVGVNRVEIGHGRNDEENVAKRWARDSKLLENETGGGGGDGENHLHLIMRDVSTHS